MNDPYLNVSTLHLFSKQLCLALGLGLAYVFVDCGFWIKVSLCEDIAYEVLIEKSILDAFLTVNVVSIDKKRRGL